MLHSINLTLEQGESWPSSGSRGRARRRRRGRSPVCTTTGPARSSSATPSCETSARARSTDVRRQIQYIFQNPYGSLNPRKTIGETVGQPLAVFGIASGREAETRVGEMLEQVSLSASYARRYPDQCSGGERQRVAIARALISKPSVLICDEITSALDVSVQAAIVELLGELQRDLGLSMVFVTHNLPLVRSIAQKVAVLADGSIVEYGETAEMLANPQQEYTRHLISDTPSLETATGEARALEQPSCATRRGRARQSPPRDRSRPARHPHRDGGPADDGRHAVPRQRRHAGAGDGRARRERRGVRQRLHRQPAVHAGTRCPDDGSAAVAHAALRQRRRLLLGDPDVRPPPAQRRATGRCSRARCTSAGRTSSTASRSG